MLMKFINFMNSFVEKFDTPKNSKLAKISTCSLKFCSKSHISILDEFQQVRAENLS